ncbi:MAG: hypothetical protein NTY96_12200 [Bacteroidetes bacterium]|nr:hypothetical protein [Bacteroidota bacterium]
MNRVIALLIPVLLFISKVVFPQCCSTGSPVGATVYVGVLAKNNLRFVTYFRNSYSNTYYQGNSKTEDNVPLRFSYYNFAGLAFGYGVTKRLTVEVDFGYFLNKTQEFKYIDFKETGYGLTNGGVGVKYGIYIKPSRQIEFTAGAGFRYPFTTKPQELDGVQLSRDVQPSTNAFAVNIMLFFNKGWPSVGIRLFTLNRFEYNFADKLKYQYGSVLLNSVFFSKKIIPYFFAILQVRGEWRSHDNDDGVIRENSGNYLLIVSPQLSYSVAGKWNVSVLYDFPVYKSYNGKQLTPRYSFAVSISHDFDLNRKKMKVNIETLPK